MIRFFKIILIIAALIMMLAYNISYASMADFTDEQADEITKHNQEEWKKKQEEKINKSSNNYLKSLSVENYNITPEFDKQTINYEIKEVIQEEYITVITETDDDKSSVSGNGKITLNSGENNLRIDVTAENGTVRTYFIKVTKEIIKDNTLSSLELKDENNDSIEFTPEFNKDVFEYSCSIENYINKINVNAKSDNEKADIKVVGNDDLHEGLNEIVISVIQDNKKTLYKINAYKKEQQIVLDNNKKIDYKLIIIVSLIIVIVFLIGIIIKKKHRTVGKHG